MEIVFYCSEEITKKGSRLWWLDKDGGWWWEDRIEETKEGN